MHCPHVHKNVQFDEIAQADELSKCVRLLSNIHYKTILLRHVPQLFFNFQYNKTIPRFVAPRQSGIMLTVYISIRVGDLHIKQGRLIENKAARMP